jgi:Zn finger protein HypA/HybF involved in hydrogenase expression
MAMGFVQRLIDVFTVPVVKVTLFECSDCGLVLDTEEAVCPECDGEVIRIESGPSYVYWDPMM